MSREKDVLPKVRRARLADLIDRTAHGNAAEFARMHGLGQSLVSRYFTVAGEYAKPMGYIAARNMERTVGLVDGYLDDDSGMPSGAQAAAQAPAAAVAKPPQRAARPVAAVDALAQAVQTIASQTPPDRRDIVMGLIQAIMTASPPNPVLTMLLAEELKKH